MDWSVACRQSPSSGTHTLSLTQSANPLPHTQQQRQPIRSVLFTPGCRPAAMKKALSSPADVLTFDLEDSVAPDRKAEARELVCLLIGHSMCL